MVARQFVIDVLANVCRTAKVPNVLGLLSYLRRSSSFCISFGLVRDIPGRCITSWPPTFCKSTGGKKTDIANVYIVRWNPFNRTGPQQSASNHGRCGLTTQCLGPQVGNEGCHITQAALGSQSFIGRLITIQVALYNNRDSLNCATIASICSNTKKRSLSQTHRNSARRRRGAYHISLAFVSSLISCGRYIPSNNTAPARCCCCCTGIERLSLACCTRCDYDYTAAAHCYLHRSSGYQFDAIH